MSRTTKSTQILQSTPWLDLIEDEVIDPNGNDACYTYVHLKKAGAYIAALTGEKIWLVGQYRYPHKQYSWELPSGGRDMGETMEQCAIRELQEEIGMRPGELQYMMTVHQSNCITDETNEVYIATDLESSSPQNNDPTELLKTKLVKLHEAYSLVVDGTIKEAVTIAVITRLYIDMISQPGNE